MSRIKIKIALNNSKFIFNGIKTQNSIIYKDNDTNVKIIIDNNINLIRENKDFKIELLFQKNKKTNCKCFLKNYNKYLNLLIETKILEYDEKSLHILYKINDDNINFKLEFEEI